MRCNILKLSLALIGGSTALITPAGAQTNIFFGNQRLFFGGDEVPFTTGVNQTLMMPIRLTAKQINANIQDINRQSFRVVWRSNVATYRHGDLYFDLNGQRVNLPARSITSTRNIVFVPFAMLDALTDGRLIDRGQFFPGPGNPGGPGGPGSGGPGSGGPGPGGGWQPNPGGGGNGGGGRPNDPWDPAPGQPVPDIAIRVDGRLITFIRNAEPFRKSGTVMVALDPMSIFLGYRVTRSSDGNRITISAAFNSVSYPIGASWFELDGIRRNLPTASIARNNQLFVPVELFRALAGNRLSVR